MTIQNTFYELKTYGKVTAIPFVHLLTYSICNTAPDFFLFLTVIHECYEDGDSLL